jgi:Domain of unknown function (DUF4157)/Effector protein
MRSQQRERSNAARAPQDGAMPQLTSRTETRTETQALELVEQNVGQSLESGTQALMEGRFDHRFDQVRVFHSADAAQATGDLSARAYTVGSNIVFNTDQYRPESAEGQHVLAHELAHVVQNERFAGTLAHLPTSGQRSDRAEADAHHAASRAISGQTAQISSSPSAQIAKWEWWDRVSAAADQEGVWNTMTDLSGAVDRQRAQAELADRFTVSSDATAIPAGAAGNVVSQEEYQRIARTYSNIRLGRGDLTLDTSSINSDSAATSYGMTEEQYRANAMNDIASLMQTRSGRAEVTQLSNNPLVDDSGNARHSLLGFELPQMSGDLDGLIGDDPVHHHTTIQPLLNTDGTADNTNGYARAVSGDDKNRNADGSRGAGSDSVMSYNPGATIAPANRDPSQDAWLPWRSDVLLSHELRHSLDHTQGTFDSSIVQASDGVAYDADGHLKRGEHAASGLGLYADPTTNPISENRYRAERRDIAAGGVGVRDGDAAMVDRTNYYYHGLPSPAPTPGSGSPGTMPLSVPLDPHGHDDD